MIFKERTYYEEKLLRMSEKMKSIDRKIIILQSKKVKFINQCRKIGLKIHYIDCIEGIKTK